MRIKSYKSSIISILFVLILCASAIDLSFAQSATNVEPVLSPTEAGIPLHPDVHFIVVDPAIKYATPYWLFLVTDDEGKATWLKDIDNCNVSDPEKERLKEDMHNLWEKYPVKFTTDGNTTTISFATSNGTLSREDNLAIKRIFEARAICVDSYNSLNFVMSPEWAGIEHSDIASDAAEKWGLENAELVGRSAIEPDYWQVNIPYWLPQGIKNFIRNCLHSYDHYYNPALSFGDAPGNTATYAIQAKNKLPDDPYNASILLGWSSHFIQDVGNPMHTGGDVNQANDYYYHPRGYPDMHTAYEGYVTSNWNDRYEFKNVVTGNNRYIVVTDPAKSTKDAATFSNKYCETIIVTISNHRDTFPDDQNIKLVTENCILETSKYELGLVHYVKGNN
ncbi:MAG TPA: hypothetical protein VHO70_04860 [Chitinispirillaceae bacterium]|nr:hypothetical protein [Chitinispirillaceae bacterium]